MEHWKVAKHKHKHKHKHWKVAKHKVEHWKVAKHKVEHWKVAKHSTATSSLRSREQRPRVTFLIVHCCTLCLGYLGSQKSKYIEIIY